MKAVRIGVVLLVLGPLVGCNKGAPDFTKAVVGRPVTRNGMPVFDAAGVGKKEERAVTDRDTVAKLASFFPGVARGKVSMSAGGWKAGYWVKFDRADGGPPVKVTVNHKADTWSEGNGDWDAEPGLKEFLDKLFTDGGDGATEKKDSGRASDEKLADREEALRSARKALEEVLAQLRKDPALKPLAGSEPKVEATEGAKEPTVSLNYATPDHWPDMPAKPRNGPANGRVQIEVVPGPVKTGLDCPFQPPHNCYYGLSAYGTSVPGLNVFVWCMTADPDAHERLEKVVRTKLKDAGITLNDRPLAVQRMGNPAAPSREPPLPGQSLPPAPPPPADAPKKD
jgi:hypothetical protein